MANFLNDITGENNIALDDLLAKLIENGNILTNGFSLTGLINKLKIISNYLISIWYSAWVLSHFVPTCKELFQLLNREASFSSPMLIDFMLLLIKLAFPITFKPKDKCICTREKFKEELYDYVEFREREKFLKNLQM